MKPFFCLALLFFLSYSAGAQKYLVRFTDKGNNPFSLASASEFLSQKALDRRSRYHLALDSTDLPVTPRYIDSIAAVPGVRVLNASRWLNQVSVSVSGTEALDRINQFPFVQQTTRITNSIEKADRPRNKPMLGFAEEKVQQQPAEKNALTLEDYFDYGRSKNQLDLHNGSFLHNIGLRGQGMVMGILDAGFSRYTTLPSFDSVRANGQILGTWDFVANEASVAEDHAHGMHCFSIIAANIPGTFVGTAPKAAFYLFRSEDPSSEYPVEEHNWVCAAERLDSAGGDVLSSSLGYNLFDKAVYNHTYAQMDGNTTIAAIGADLAAKKGILVVNSAGNSGDEAWKYIATPADGDSVLAVGAVNAAGQAGSFSSYGPAADGRVKPDVASLGVGTIIQNTNGSIGSGNGTSYACPNMAGLAACLWQGFPELNNMAIINALQQAGSTVQQPNNRIGYGIPDVKKAVALLLKDVFQAEATAGNCKVQLQWYSKDVASMKYELERRAPGENSFTKISERPGSGSSFAAHTHTWTDTLTQVAAGTITYRIRQVLDTALNSFSAVYLDTLSVNIAPSCSLHEQLTIVPNPVRGNQLTLQATFAEAVANLQVVLTNSSGQQVLLQKASKPAGTSNMTLQIPHLAAGTYYASVYNDKKKIATKEFIKQ